LKQLKGSTIPVSLTAVRWLKSHWTLISEGKSEDEALVFGQSVVPQMSANDFKSTLDVSLHHHQYTFIS